MAEPNRTADTIAKRTNTASKSIGIGTRGITSESLFAWGFLFAGLIILSDFPGAGELSAAFAMLILISVLLAFGPAAFDNISTLFRSS